MPCTNSHPPPRVLSHDIPQPRSPVSHAAAKPLAFAKSGLANGANGHARAGNGHSAFVDGANGHAHAANGNGVAKAAANVEGADGEGDEGLPMPEPFKIKSERGEGAGSVL